MITFGVGYGASLLIGPRTVPNLEALVYRADAARQFNYRRNWRVYLWILAGYFVFLILVLKGIEWMFE